MRWTEYEYVACMVRRPEGKIPLENLRMDGKKALKWIFK
jgi:hypothetical protein